MNKEANNTRHPLRRSPHNAEVDAAPKTETGCNFNSRSFSSGTRAVLGCLIVFLIKSRCARVAANYYRFR